MLLIYSKPHNLACLDEIQSDALFTLRTHAECNGNDRGKIQQLLSAANQSEGAHLTFDTQDFISPPSTTEENSIPHSSGGFFLVFFSLTDIIQLQQEHGSACPPTGQECYLADEQPAVGEVELAQEDLSRPGPQGEGDGPGGGVLQVLQGHVQGQGRGPRLEDAGFELTLHLVEDPHALGVTVVAVHLETEMEGGRGGVRTAKVEAKPIQNKAQKKRALIIQAFAENAEGEI